MPCSFAGADFCSGKAKLDCVKNERFATITLESVLPGDRIAYAVETLAKAFYPDVFE